MSENGGTLTEAEPNVFTIPSENMGQLTSELEKLNRRAARLGTAPISVTVLSTEVKEEKIPGWTLDNGEVLEWRTIAREWNTVRVDGETPMLNGWQFVATLIHGENGCVIKRVPTFDTEVDLSQYRDADPSNCDHCKRDRRRIDTFVVYNAETGETKQIGRQCLKDFLGYNDPMAVARQLERIKEFIGRFSDEDEEGFRTQRALFMVSVYDYFVHVACIIRTEGWTARSQVTEENRATSDAAWWNMVDYGQKDRNGRDMFITTTDEDKAVAEAAAEWNKDHWNRDGNEFESNMAVAFAGEYFNERLKGFVAYGVQAYLKDQTEQLERAAKDEATPSEWQGEVGKRQVFTGLTVTAERTIADEWGERTSYLFTLVDEAGNDFKWFASNDVLTVGQTYDLKATVKKHDEWKGQKQTLITRAKVQ